MVSYGIKLASKEFLLLMRNIILEKNEGGLYSSWKPHDLAPSYPMFYDKIIGLRSLEVLNTSRLDLTDEYRSYEIPFSSSFSDSSS